jgi:uncharacterized phage protein (TIGR02220 family)
MGRKPEKPVESILKEHNDVTLKAFMVNDLHLSGNELIIFAVIYSFSQDGESCFYGSRRYLASWCQIHEGAVDYQLNKLLKKGLITKSHTRREDGSLCSILRANLSLIESIIGQSQKFESGRTKICDNHAQKFSTGHTQKFMTNKEEANTKVDTKEDKGEIPFSEITDYLNEKAGTRYRPTTAKTQKSIRARWNEGYRLDDFRRVIDVKCAEWKGTDFEKYLCPETLFGTKFEKYLNQPMVKAKKSGVNWDADLSELADALDF